MEITRNCAVFSIYCITAVFGSFQLFKPQNMDHFWIDFNYTSHTVSFHCQLRQNNSPEELFIRIRIDTLKIDNQFNCIIISPEPATFTGTEVPAELKNARIAVFTLPPSEIERLKANKDLLSFYYRSQNYSNSESDVPPTPNTIENYLGEDSQTVEGPINQEVWDNINLLQAASPLQPNPGKSIVKEKPSTKTHVKNNVVTKNVLPKETSVCKSYLSLPNSVATNMESGYNTAVSTDKKNSSVFKKPNKPISQPVRSEESGYSTGVSTAKKELTIFKKPVTPLRMQDQPTESIKSVPTQPANQQRTNLRSSKAIATQAAVTPLANKTKRTYRKKLKNNTGLSPKRKQVNTVKPLNHLIQPDCDPVEANMEYVENGGYFNIIQFLKSKAGTTCFNEQQRQQILKNIKIIYENIEQGTRRSKQKADATSDSDADSIILRKARRKRCNTGQGVAVTSDFVPYSQWKTKQKEKSDGQSTLLFPNSKGNKQSAAAENRVFLSAPDPLKNSESNNRSRSQPSSSKPRLSLNELNISESQQPASEEAITIQNSFDRLKMTESNRPPCSKPKTSTCKPVAARNKSSVSSESSCSNHNFQIVDSDSDQMAEAYSDQEATIVDMVCRAVPEDMEISPSPLVPSKHDHDSAEIEASWTECLRNIVDAPRNYSQSSEIYEDLDEYPPADPMPSEMIAAKSISFHESQCQCLSIDSSSFSQEAAINCSQVTPQMSPTPTRPGVPKRNPDSANTWLIEKYFREQRPQLRSPTCFDTSPDQDPFDTFVDPPNAPIDAQLNTGQDVPTVQPQNVTIIQNQFIMSAVRKRKTSAVNEDYPLSKIPSIGDQVPLIGYPQLLSSFVERLNNEKDRLMREFETSPEDVLESTSQVVDEILKSIADHETAIHETQEELSSVYVKLETLIENQQKKKFELENVYLKLIGRIKASIPKEEDIDQAYQKAAEQLKNYATASTNELWQGFANVVIGSVQDRLRRLVEM